MNINQIKQLAERGDAKSQCELGRLYLNGEGVPQDYNQALQWLQKAAGQGSGHASYLIGYMYLNGIGVRKDSQLADKWLGQSSNEGYSQGFTINSMSMPEGFMQKLRDAANQGDTNAQEMLEDFNRLMP